VAVGHLAIEDTVRPEAGHVIDVLTNANVATVLLSGDREAVVQRVAEHVRIPTIHARILPMQKAEIVAQYQQGGKAVAMVGDGINDAVALAQADVGIAMGSGTDVAIEAASITIMRNDLRALTVARTLARRTVRTIRQNFFWAFIYNVIGIPVAAAGILDPSIAAAAMALSSVSVIANSLRLRAVGNNGG
jgi:Cu+-exporting ATPase